LFRYTVRPGDTLYKIAAQLYVPIDAIMAVNPGLNPYDLLIGQVIMIPTEYARPRPYAAPPPSQPREYY
jgi:LysM repeat protein